jgi:DNA-directed RNA polymerase subunit RPC12/RpoP
MHQKEQVMAPLLERALGVRVEVVPGLDTDAFGTFAGEVERPAGQSETAKLKCQRALAQTGADLAVASEGAFGPHPSLAFVPANVELVTLLDSRHLLQVTGQYLTTDTNFAQQTVSSWAEASAFAEGVGFPAHGLIVRGPGDELAKGLTDPAQFRQLVEHHLALAGEARLETDMRALYNPTRMRAIGLATQDLLERLQTACPRCSSPGFGLAHLRPGLPCSWCGLPTRLPRARVLACPKCGHEAEEPYPNGQAEADPAYCDFCNP